MPDENILAGASFGADQNLTEWANEPTLRALKTDYQSAYEDHQAHVEEVRKWRKNFDGEPKFPIIKGRSKVVPKLIRKQAEWRYTALSEPFLSSDDIFDVKPKTWEDKRRAEQNAQVLNHQFNARINKVDFIDDYVRTAVDEGTVVVKVGWLSEEGSITEDQPRFTYIPVQDPQQAQQMEQQEQIIHQLMATQPSKYKALPAHVREAHERFMRTGIPHQAQQIGTTKVTRTKLVKNHPTLEVCPYDRVILDPTCEGDLNKAQFVIYEFETTLSELKKDGRYKNLDKVKTSGSLFERPDDEFEGRTNFTFNDIPRKKLIVREYWGFFDIDNDGEVEPILAAWIGDVKIRMEKNPFPDKKLPFIKVKYLPVQRENFGHPDGHLLEDNQDIMGAVTRGMIDMLGRSAAGQQGVRKDALDVVNSRKFEAGDDFKFNANVDPRNAFHMGTFPDIPQSALSLIQLQNLEAESLTGVKAFSQGITGESLGNVATGVRGALDAASKREIGILRRLANGMIQIGHKIISMNSEFLDEEEVIRITNDDFVTVQRDDLAGRYDVQLSISTAESDNAKAQELAFMLQTIGNNTDFGILKMILADIAKLRKMPTLAKAVENYEPQPDPLVQEKARLENELLKAQIADLTAKAEENKVDVGLKTAKTATEQAKAREMHATSDQKDLDFVEQREGVKHDREIDKQETKDENELDLAVVNNELSNDSDVTNVMRNFNL